MSENKCLYCKIWLCNWIFQNAQWKEHPEKRKKKKNK